MIASKNCESGPSSVFQGSPAAPKTRPSFHGFQVQPPLPVVLQAPPDTDVPAPSTVPAHRRTGPMTMYPFAVSLRLPPRVSRFSVVDSTEPVSGTQTGLGVARSAGRLSENERAPVGVGKPVFTPGAGT